MADARMAAILVKTIRMPYESNHAPKAFAGLKIIKMKKPITTGGNTRGKVITESINERPRYIYTFNTPWSRIPVPTISIVAIIPTIIDTYNGLIISQP